MKLGYQTKRVGQTNDHGIDVTLEKDGQTSYIQCKKFITTIVPSPAMRDFYGAIMDRRATGKSYFVTTNTFTWEAEKFAEGKPIELVDRFKLVKYIRMTENQKSETKNI
jgi:restriction system protein